MNFSWLVMPWSLLVPSLEPWEMKTSSSAAILNASVPIIHLVQTVPVVAHKALVASRVTMLDCVPSHVVQVNLNAYSMEYQVRELHKRIIA